MIDTIINIAKMVAAILPFILLCFASKKVNLPGSERSKQFAMPVIALIYVVLMMLFMNTINNALLVFINKIPTWIDKLASMSWIPAQVGSVLDYVSECVSSLLKKLNLGFWIFFISNTVMISVYLILKRITISVISKVVKVDDELHTKIAEMFYVYFPEKDKWCLKEDHVQARSLFKVFYYSAVLLSGLLMLVSCRFYYEGFLTSVFYPVFGILFVGELYFYLDGATKREYTEDILGEDEETYKTVNYSLLRKFLRSLFGDKLLSENTSINSALDNDVTTDEIIHELENNEDPEIMCFASYISALNKAGYRLDHNYLRSSMDMVKGKSILFNNPFYNDLIPYAFYPMNRVLLSHQRVLVVLGRHSIEDDIKEWLERGIEAITGIPFMWSIGTLNDEEQELDIGIVTRSDVLDIELHNANADFLEKVGFVVVIEPSKLISTAQIGLNLLVKKCRSSENKNIVYCMCDKNCDGLVDAMSHILMTSMTEVSATHKHLGTSSYMCWESDDEYLHHRIVPSISRYLGIGTELSFAALKNQVTKTKWYGGEAFPVTDIRWIDKQYYYDLTKYANISTDQEAIDEHFEATPNFWSAEIDVNSYLTVEDEFFNMFEVLRDFSTRTTEQGFINVISSDYLLKDYMADNASVFEADAKAIPYIVADHTRSNRNVILRLVLMMSTFPVCTEILEKELSLLGINVFDLKKQLWYELYCCYSDVSKIMALSHDYRQAVEAVYTEPIGTDDIRWTNEILRSEESFNLKAGKLEINYSIAEPSFLRQFVSELRSAEYVAEDEKGERYYLGSELNGHIYQKYLPGQFFTFDGKYYEMQYLTADGQVLVRRAADHITGRPAYRQLREYTIHGVKPSDKIGARQDIAGLKVIKEFADIEVETFGYYRMERYNDFATARRVLFEGDRNGIPKRVYRNKEILRIELPDLDGKFTDEVRYTVTVLFNEIFKTIFAENQAYICAITDDSFISSEHTVKPLTYSLKGDGYEIERRSVYIIEDSQLDLGLIVAVERNLQRIFGIIHDYIDWHMEKLDESLDPPIEPTLPVVFGGEEAVKTKKNGIRSFFAAIGRGIKKLLDKIKGLFKRKDKKAGATETAEVPDEDISADGISDATGEHGDDANVKKEEKAAKKKSGNGFCGLFKRKRKTKPENSTSDDGNGTTGSPKSAERSDTVENTDISDAETGSTDEADANEVDKDTGQQFNASTEELDMSCSPLQSDIAYSCESAPDLYPVERKPYHKRYYMLFGNENEYPFIDLKGALDYVSEIDTRRNYLKQARDGKHIADLVAATYKYGKPDSRYCDFCGVEILGVEYETLADGRDRCMRCGKSAIKTGEEFRKVFYDVKRNMESFFGIKINAGIKVEMVNSRTLHKRLKKAFIPTPKSDGRVLGVAINDKNGYTLLVENGSPRMASMLTIAHELTHIWQYINWNDKAIRKAYGKKLRLEIYEGMAKWVEIQYAYLINEPATAKREEIMTFYRDDEYGRGFIRYRANYPFSTGTIITKVTPFMNLTLPLAPEFCGPFTIIAPSSGVNVGDVDNEVKKTADKRSAPTKADVNKLKHRTKECGKYAYGLLNDEEKAMYDVFLDALDRFDEEVSELPACFKSERVQKILDHVQADHPEIFWFRHGGTFYSNPTTDIVEKLTFTYCMTKEECERRKAKIDIATRSFLKDVDGAMSDYEVMLRIYENIIKLADYDTIGLEHQNEMAVPADRPDDLRSIYGVLVNKKAVCAGYAKTMQYLLNMCGIECIYVTSDTHAWNIVKLEGDYYHIDVTWGDSSNTEQCGSMSNVISYDHCCITTDEVLRLDMHMPSDRLPLPDCTATKYNYHRYHGLYFEQYDRDAIFNVVKDSVANNKHEIYLKFASADVYAVARAQLIDKGGFAAALRFAASKVGVAIDGTFAHVDNDQIYTMTFLISY